MARVAHSGLDIRSASQLTGLLAFDGHRVRRLHCLVPVAEFLNAEIVFVGGAAAQYLPLLRRLRGLNRSLPIIVVAPFPETAEWLDALDAGATDYCVPPFDMRQVSESADAGRRASAVGRHGNALIAVPPVQISRLQFSGENRARA